MPRKGPAVKREIEPDPIYQNQLVTQLINKVLLSGKRSLAERIVYKALEDRPNRGTTLALRWLVNYSRARREHSMAERLVGEIMDASNGQGSSVKRREDMHKMAEANKAFAHYRW